MSTDLKFLGSGASSLSNTGGRARKRRRDAMTRQKADPFKWQPVERQNRPTREKGKTIVSERM